MTRCETHVKNRNPAKGTYTQGGWGQVKRNEKEIRPEEVDTATDIGMTKKRK